MTSPVLSQQSKVLQTDPGACMMRTVSVRRFRKTMLAASALALLGLSFSAGSAATGLSDGFSVRAVNTADSNFSAMRGGVQSSEQKVTADVAVAKSYIAGLKTLLAQDGSLPRANGCLGPDSQYPQADHNCPMGGQDASGADSKALNDQLRAIGVKDQVLTARPGSTIMFVSGFYGNPYSILYFLPAGAKSCGVDDVMSRSDWKTHGDPMSFQNDDLTFCAVSISSSWDGK